MFLAADELLLIEDIVFRTGDSHGGKVGVWYCETTFIECRTLPSSSQRLPFYNNGPSRNLRGAVSVTPLVAGARSDLCRTRFRLTDRAVTQRPAHITADRRDLPKGTAHLRAWPGKGVLDA
jgi:hypothetical protein